MRERTTVLYERRELFKLESLAADLAGGGLRSSTGGLGRVELLDEEGEAEEVDHVTFASHLQSMPNISFLWWLNAEVAMFTRVTKGAAVVRVEMDMDGMSFAQRSQMGQALGRRFRMGDQRSVGWVFDPEGWTGGMRWDGFYLAGDRIDWQAVNTAFPMNVGMRKENLERIANIPSEVVRDCVDQLVVLASPESYPTPSRLPESM